MTEQAGVGGSCHCGEVRIVLKQFPPTFTECDCSLCRRYGVLWAYLEAESVAAMPDDSLTDRYAWNGRHVDFHRCKRCGCVTHWLPKDSRRRSRGINARLFEPAVLANATRVFRDGAGK